MRIKNAKMFLRGMRETAKDQREFMAIGIAVRHIDRLEFAMRSIGALASQSKEPAMVQIAAMAREGLE